MYKRQDITAASLIDAIIIEQISQEPGPPAAKPHGLSPVRAAAGACSVSILERLRTDTSTNEQAAASTLPPKMCSPTAAEKQQKPSPGETGHAGRKDLTLGEHIHSIIMHDFKQKDGAAADGSAFDASANIGEDFLMSVL